MHFDAFPTVRYTSGIKFQASLRGSSPCPNMCALMGEDHHVETHLANTQHHGSSVLGGESSLPQRWGVGAGVCAF